MPIKVMTVVGTRPEVIKLSRVIAELDRRVSHVLVHTGQNYDHELNQVFFEQLGIRKPDHFLECAAGSVAETIAHVISRSDRVLAKEKPDALLVLGDTNSCLAVIAAKRRKVPVFHMEAGNRCFDERVPEEINRRIVDHTADINLAYTEHARRYLLAEGLRPETVMKTGSPMFEVLRHYQPRIRRSPVLRTLGLAPGRYFVVSAHREENVDNPRNLRGLLDALAAVSKRYGHKIIFSTHPRTRARLSGAGARRSSRIEFLKPLGFLDYVKLQMNARCVLSDSGTLTEESSILGFPAVMIRQAHERPEGMDEAAVIMADLKPARVMDAIELAVAHYSGRKRPFRVVGDYTADNVSQKVVRIILSYTDYVNRTVWRK
ncbi:MAG: UDP-N-acetylglucosamine 2-epimerase (non-hydrolyzing) [Betaproteobacteria bacterium]|nr:UDP-N-acetylglucosamine 2-epimerase (non-hydrolyzing) [Betaproteobacteria bacterium]